MAASPPGAAAVDGAEIDRLRALARRLALVLGQVFWPLAQHAAGGDQMRILASDEDRRHPLIARDRRRGAHLVIGVIAADELAAVRRLE